MHHQLLLILAIQHTINLVCLHLKHNVILLAMKFCNRTYKSRLLEPVRLVMPWSYHVLSIWKCLMSLVHNLATELAYTLV